MAEVIDPIRNRRARRAFDPRPVPQDVREALWTAVSLAPSHGNNQPTRIVTAVSEAARAALTAALSSGNRHWASAAPLLAAVCSIPGHDLVQENSDGSTRELWAFHGGIAVGNLLAQATAMGLTAHPMAGFDEPAVRGALGVPGGVRVLTVVAIGYPGKVESLVADRRKRETAPQRRLPIDHVAADDRWRPEQSLSMKEYRDRTAPR